MRTESLKLTKFCGLLALTGLMAGVLANVGPAQAEPYVYYRAYSAPPPPPAPWSIIQYNPWYNAAPNCRYRAVLAGPADSPEFGLDYRCVELLPHKPRRRAVVRVKG
jgi:hypothetical protein